VDAPWIKEPVMRVVVAGATGAIGKQLVPTWPRRRSPRLAAGEVGAVLMAELRGASNANARAKVKRELAWQPARPGWRQGLAT
jgi:hypothetical protein